MQIARVYYAPHTRVMANYNNVFLFIYITTHAVYTARVRVPPSKKNKNEHRHTPHATLRTPPGARRQDPGRAEQQWATDH